MKKHLVTLSAILLLILGIVLWRVWGSEFELVLTEGEIQAKLEEKFPIRKTLFFVLDIELAHPAVALEEGTNRVSFGCDAVTNLSLGVNGEKQKGPLRGTLKISGSIRYDADRGSFYLEEPRLDDFEMTGIPEQWRKRIAGALPAVISELLSRAPIYTLKSTDIKQAAARLVLRDVKVRDRKLQITMGIG